VRRGARKCARVFDGCGSQSSSFIALEARLRRADKQEPAWSCPSNMMFISFWEPRFLRTTLSTFDVPQGSTPALSIRKESRRNNGLEKRKPRPMK